MNAGRNLLKVMSVELGIDSKGQQVLDFLLQHANGDSINYKRWLTDAAFEFTCKELDKMGWNPRKHGFAFDVLCSDDSPLLGREFVFECENREYTTDAGERKSRLEVKWVAGGGGGLKETMTTNQAAAFSRHLRSKFGIPEPRPAQRPAANSMDFDDDNPF